MKLNGSFTGWRLRLLLNGRGSARPIAAKQTRNQSILARLLDPLFQALIAQAHPALTAVGVILRPHVSGPIYTVQGAPDYNRNTGAFTTDFRSAVQGAIDAAVAAGEKGLEVLFPHSHAHSFYIGGPLTAPLGFHLTLSGVAMPASGGNLGTQLAFATSAAQDALSFTASVGQSVALTMRDIGLTLAIGSTGRHGIHIEDGLDGYAYFERVHVFGFSAGSGFRLDNTYNTTFVACYSRGNSEGWTLVDATSQTELLNCSGFGNLAYNFRHTGTISANVNIRGGDWTITSGANVNCVSIYLYNLSNSTLDGAYIECYRASRSSPIIHVDSDSSVWTVTVRNVQISEQTDAGADVALMTADHITGLVLDTISFVATTTAKRALTTGANAASVLILEPSIRGSSTFTAAAQSAASYITVRNGRIGINTTDPDQPIHLRGSGIQNVLLECTAGKAYVVRSHTDGRFYLRNNTDGKDVLVVDPDGIVTVLDRVKADTLAERTAAAGVTADDVKLKDGYIVPNATAGESGAIGTAGGDAYVHDGTAPRKIQDAADKGVANGIATLDGSALIPTAQIPNLDAAKIASGDIAAARLANACKAPASNGYSDQSALGFGASRRPSTTRPTLVVGTVRVTLDENEEGRVRVLCDSADPPTTLLMEPGGDANPDAVGDNADSHIVSFTFIVPPNDYYRLDTVDTTGTPAFTLVTLRELTL